VTLSAAEVAAIVFAGKRQLTRWAARQLTPQEAERRTALIGAVRVLENGALRDGCELRSVPVEGSKG
jgi:hypothetical protein